MAHMISNPIWRFVKAIAFFIIAVPGITYAHGGVVAEDDLCVINIGYLKAHFKIYVPQQTGHKEYCEDIPVRGESVFVMEYQHNDLNAAEIDFRIIKNTTGKSNFARLEDVEAIDNIDGITVHYSPSKTFPDVFTLLQNFDEDGEYIGIVSAAHADTRKVYIAVFPFEVGYVGLGIWPWIIAALLFLQVNYWLMNRRQKTATVALVMLLGVFFLNDAAADGDSVFSDDGQFQVSYESDLKPIVINKIHGWTLSIRSADGSAVTDAEITIKGGMPEHDHGLPTEPRIVENMGNGRYRVAGMRFHMNGYWEVAISIDAGSRHDDAIIRLHL